MHCAHECIICLGGAAEEMLRKCFKGLKIVDLWIWEELNLINRLSTGFLFEKIDMRHLAFLTLWLVDILFLRN